MRSLSCHSVYKFQKKLFLNLKHKFKNLLHILMCCSCSFLQSGGCLATLGGSCLHSGGSRRPGVPSLLLYVLFTLFFFAGFLLKSIIVSQSKMLIWFMKYDILKKIKYIFCSFTSRFYNMVWLEIMVRWLIVM